MKKFLLVLVTFVCFGISSSVYAQKKVPCPNNCNNGKVTERCDARGCYNGAIPCTSCGGSGKKSERCSCDGGYVSKTVQKKCTNCNGARYFRENQPVPCNNCRGGQRPVNNGGTVTYVKCQNCNGTGQKDNYVNVACRPCGASGYSGTETVRERCSRSGCSNGYITGTCNTCNGRTGTVCTKCNGYANIQKDCRRCNGNGFIYVSE